jgi:hypothetical protein
MKSIALYFCTLLMCGLSVGVACGGEETPASAAAHPTVAGTSAGTTEASAERHSVRGPPVQYELYSSNPHAFGANVPAWTRPTTAPSNTPTFTTATTTACRANRASVARVSAWRGCEARWEANYPVSKVVSRLKIRTCGSKRVTVTFLNPSQAVGSLAPLFRQEPV